MANILTPFLNNLKSGVLEPKGNLGDFAHAARLYVDDSFRLAPKSKFLFHVVFNINQDVLNRMIANSPAHPNGNRIFKTLSNFKNKHQNELNMLVKNVDLPQYSIETVVAQQYNKKRKLHTKISYDPIKMVFHDDNYGVTTALWEMYYRYYFRDGWYGADESAKRSPEAFSIHRGSVDEEASPFSRSLAYNSAQDFRKFRFGLDNDQHEAFFDSIQIFHMSRKRYTMYHLVNPIITQWQHDTLNNADSEPAANSMAIEYEAVFYGRGAVSEGVPRGFAEEHYDQTPSPNSLSGGGTTSVFGTGGVASALGLFGGQGGPNTDISGGETGRSGFTLGNILRGANAIKNARNLSKAGLAQEGFNILKGAVGRIGGTADSSYTRGGGLGDTVIARSSSKFGNTVKALIRKR
tara:strand:+ start:1799 stop:3019 length:1221 start_codon:yes stop_codon:yes gene_type:complete